MTTLPPEMLITSGGHNTVPLRLATCFSNPSSSASLDNFYPCPAHKGTPFSQNPAPVPFFNQGLGVFEGQKEAPLSKPDISKLSLANDPWKIGWFYVFGRKYTRRAWTILQDHKESQNVHTCAHTPTTVGVCQRAQAPAERAPNVSNKLINAV